jgi:type II secretory ATPase GspE/PulE/Tfp pilus assembly ATPase PilB-like protein
VWLPSNGCKDCRHGYAGRSVVAEIVKPDQELLNLLCAGERRAAEKYWLERLNGRTFIHHAFDKIIAGTVDPLQIEARIGKLELPCP